MSWVVGIVIVDDVSRATEFEIAGIPFEFEHAQILFNICKRGRSYIGNTTVYSNHIKYDGSPVLS